MSFLERLGGVYDETTAVLVCGDQHWTLAELQTRVLHWRARLALPAGYAVALYADNSFDWIAIDIACMEAGLVFVPLPPFFSDQQLRHVLAAVRPALLLSDDPQRTSALWFCAASAIPGSSLHMARDQDAEPPRVPAGTVKITFTSGSTGEPRGVCLSLSQQLKQADRLAGRVALAGTRHLGVLPLSTLLENIAGVYAPLLTGSTVVVSALSGLGFTGSSELDARRFVQAISQAQPETLILIPQLLQVLVAAARAGWQPPVSLKFVAVGGSRVAPGLVLAARECAIPAYEGYGLSECGSVVSLNVPEADRPGTTGKPLSGLGVSIEDGEVVVSGNAMLGYLDDESSWNQPRIRTGDLGAIDDEGFLAISGRARNLLISSYGRNISPEWVESELLQNPLLADAVVFGDARPYCTALLSFGPAGADSAGVEHLAHWVEQVNQRLPDYARVRRWHLLDHPLVAEPDLVTANGRPRREAIAARFAGDIDRLYELSFDPARNVAAS